PNRGDPAGVDAAARKPGGRGAGIRVAVEARRPGAARLRARRLRADGEHELRAARRPRVSRARTLCDQAPARRGGGVAFRHSVRARAATAYVSELSLPLRSTPAAAYASSSSSVSYS